MDKNKLFNDLKKSNIDKRTIESAAKTGDTQKLIDSLSDSDKQKLLKVMSDKEAMNEILKSPQAQALLKLFGGKNG